MAFPFSSALAKLDDSLQGIRLQVEQLGAGMEVNSQQLDDLLAEARHHGATLRDLITADYPDAKWVDRESLGQLVEDLEIAIRRNQERRAKLVALAAELEAGTVRHRFQARSTELNALRLDAIKELRSEAALPEQGKELPGPNASDWLHWVCNLEDDKHAAEISNLRRDFPALESFAAEIEESYWVAGTPSKNGSGAGYESSAGPTELNAGPAYAGASLEVVTQADKLPPAAAGRWQTTVTVGSKEYLQSKA